MAVSEAISVRIKNEDLKIMKENNIKVNQDFIHQAVLQTVNNGNTDFKNGHDNSPSFLFTDKATNQELYSYLKENPTASRFIFKKYSANQSFLKELCDPENPIYLGEVANNLQGIYHVKEEEKNIELLRSEKSRLTSELEKLKAEIKEAGDQYDEMDENLERIKKEDEAYNMQRSNIRTDRGLEMITTSYSDITKHFDVMLQRWNTYFKEHGGATLGMVLNSEDFNHMDLLNKNIKTVMDQIRTQEFLSTDGLDKFHQEMMEKEKQEKENALNSLDAIRATNARKVIPKVLDDIGLSIRHFERASVNMEGMKYFNKVGETQVLEPLNDAYRLMDNLGSQIENMDRREKEKK